VTLGHGSRYHISLGMRQVLLSLPWLASLLLALGIIGMEMIGGGGMPMFPLLALYVPILLAGLLSLPGTLANRSRLPSRAFLLMMIAALYLIPRTMVGGDPGLRSYELLRMGGLFLTYMILSVSLVDKGPRLLLIFLICVSAIFQTAVEMYQIYIDPLWQPLSLYLPELNACYPQTVGTYANKNHLAWLLCAAALFSLAMACWGRAKWTTRSASLYFWLFFSTGVLLSLSRGGSVSLVLGLALFGLLSLMLLFLSGNRSSLISGVIVAGIIGFLGVMLTRLLLGDANIAARLQGVWMDPYREDLWRAAAHDFGAAPFFGMGAGSFQWSARLMMPHESLLAHNDFAQLLSEYGLVGLLLVTASLCAHLAHGFKCLVGFSRPLPERGENSIRFSDSRAILIGCLAVVLAEIVHSFFDFNMHLGANALIAGTCLGMLSNPSLQRKKDDHGRAWFGPAVGALQVFLCLLLGLLCLRNWKFEKDVFHADMMSHGIVSPEDYERSALLVAAATRACDALPPSARNAAIFVDLLDRRGPIRGMTPRAVLDLRLRVLGKTVAGDPGAWYPALKLAQLWAVLGDEKQANKSFALAMQRLPLFALTYEEYALFLGKEGAQGESAHYFRLSKRFQDAHDRGEKLP